MTIRVDIETTDLDLEALVGLALSNEEVILTIGGRDAERLTPVPDPSAIKAGD
ncbi:MAG: hypothetical protein K0M78_14205 [Brevundimonas sp.]|nr:hypothetical protein [Brevundimonas sp.]